MTTLLAHERLRRTARLGLAGAALLAAAGGAAADDGFGGFFASFFGGPQQAAPAPAPQVYGPGPAVRRRTRPLVIRLHPARPRLAVSAVPARPGPVSVFVDPTLRPGDAVMMSTGLRVFAGSRAWPYRPADFVALRDARTLDRAAVRELAQVNRPPRS